MFSSCFPGARLDLSNEDNVIALALAKCSARPYAELIKSNIPSSSSLLPARSTASRFSPLSTLGNFPFGPTAATPTRGEILVHLGATSRKPRSVKRKKPSSSENDVPVSAKVQKLGVSLPSPVREPGQASPPLAEVQNSGASPLSPAQELERASSPLVLTLLSPPRPAIKAKGLSGAAVAQPLTVLPITVWNPPSDKAKSPPRRTTELKRKKLKPKADAIRSSLLSSAELAASAVSSIVKESDIGGSKELPVDEALALSFQGIASVSP